MTPNGSSLCSQQPANFPYSNLYYTLQMMQSTWFNLKMYTAENTWDWEGMTMTMMVVVVVYKQHLPFPSNWYSNSSTS
jgi:hypothetical protein